ncbi:hypothetical protein IC575_019044 [Cucumis melo]|uniref:F-box protein At1g65770 n=1 Tax=Cucumis melo TaxID=3656 RepID=A0A1S4DT77_CUCME|nr:putative F-box protein At1g65770 [Cucumis melo]
MEDSRVRWSDLPPELWPIIGKRLDTYIDVLRFRSVCRSWRASLPPFNAVSPLLPLDLPSPVFAADHLTDAFLIRRIIYRLSPLDHHKTFSSASSSTSSSYCAAEGWLAKVESTKLGKMRFLHPLSTRYAKCNSDLFRKEVNLLDFGIYEVAKSYTLGYTNGSPVPRITKVVMFPDSPWIDVKKCTILAVYAGGKLGFAKHGDDKWTLIDHRNFHYDDVIVYKGQFYAVDRWGTVFWIDSSMRLVQFSPPLCGFGNQKHLVECNGELYVVDRFLDKEPLLWNADIFHIHWLNNLIEDSPPKVIDFKLHRLDQEWGRWVEVKNLGNQSFILGNDCCFSVSTPNFEGLKGSCIYFTHTPKCALGYNTHVFELEDKRILKASSNDNAPIFRPPPIWLNLEVTQIEEDAADNQ